ncbi:MAG: hypothetical protein AB8E82_07660 [Aureispira sp.]
MKKGIYFLLVLVTWCWYSCSAPEGETQDGETTSTVQGENASETTTDEGTTSAPKKESGASKITDAIVKQVCDCKKEAKQEDGTVDVERVRACMGAASSTEYVANLLGSSATDKERSDAQNELLERTENCPE